MVGLVISKKKNMQHFLYTLVTSKKKKKNKGPWDKLFFYFIFLLILKHGFVGVIMVSTHLN